MRSQLIPGAIWEKNRGEKDRVYIESTKTSLLLTSENFIDVRDEFGLKPIKLSDFLAQYHFIGWARIKINELTSDKNLILEGEEDDNDKDTCIYL